MIKVLIVEDEGILAMKTRIDLVKMGHEVIGIANNGNDAIKIAKEHHPDIVLMDIVLRGSMNGIEASGVINEDNDCKIIYMTAHTDSSTIDLAKRTKHIGFLFKPFEPFQLKEALEEALK
jgi:YesN/AraC family two-component response regulator